MFTITVLIEVTRTQWFVMQMESEENPSIDCQAVKRDLDFDAIVRDIAGQQEAIKNSISWIDSWVSFTANSHLKFPLANILLLNPPCSMNILWKCMNAAMPRRLHYFHTTKWTQVLSLKNAKHWLVRSGAWVTRIKMCQNSPNKISAPLVNQGLQWMSNQNIWQLTYLGYRSKYW